MTLIGDTLRRERLRRNLEVVNIAGELKISAKFIEAIEAEDFAKLPGGVFTKSFVRQYAAFLGLDPEEMVAEVRRIVEPAPVVPEPTDKTRPDVPGIQVEYADEWRSVSDRSVSVPSWLRAGALLITFMLVSSGLYWWWEREHHENTVEVPPATRAMAAPPVASTPPPSEPVNVAAAPASPEPVAQPVATSPSPTASTQQAQVQTPAPPPAATSSITPVLAPNPNATVRVGITADEPAWLSAKVNGKYLFSGILQANETRNIDVDGQVDLRLGNAGGVTITLNGKAIPPVGPKGQIRNVQLTSGGFQIVSVPRSLDPLDRL